MSSALYVTTKGFCKRAWIRAFLAVGTLVLVPLLARVVTQFEGTVYIEGDIDFIGCHFAYLGLSWALFLGVCLHALTGIQQTCLRLPISSRVIATWLMLAMVGLVVLLQLVTNGVYQMLFFDEQKFVYYWTVLGPLLFMTTLIFVSHAIFWSMHAPSFIRLILAIGLIVAMFWWFFTRYYPHGINEEIVPWNHVTLSEFVIMLVLCVASWFQGTRAFGQVRSGTAVPSPHWNEMVSWWGTLGTESELEIPVGLSSLRSSLARLHWRDSCHRTVVVGSVGIGLTVLIINLIMGAQLGFSDPGKGEVAQFCRSTLRVALEFSFVAALVIPVLLAKGIRGTGTTGMKQFLARSPLSDRDFSAVLYWNMVKMLGYTCLLIQLGLILSYSVMAFFIGSDVFKGELTSRPVLEGIYYSTILTVIGFWVISANLVSITWTGRTSFCCKIIGGAIVGYLFLFVLDNKRHWFYYGGEIRRCMYLIPSTLILAGTLTAYVVACRKKLISLVTVRIALTVWLVSVVGFSVSILLLKQELDFNLWFVLFLGSAFMALIALVIAPFATIPLALSWNRHR